ncbi:109aa long hypothetical protein [Pyrococcus horikoshii OT3]|uniref:Uncharacterized protein n=1 Tax=Pyrococcus horikoshii (strain ATCC 700860 / DSM 12428 / JCM 9974 / NBRC 100139 / OT-3) TaxID=70601 RepID=O58881_PYRHO|nr:109aa long hypothetical protein [Pyrococcus horikoshii OT3]
MRIKVFPFCLERFQVFKLLQHFKCLFYSIYSTFRTSPMGFLSIHFKVGFNVSGVCYMDFQVGRLKYYRHLRPIPLHEESASPPSFFLVAHEHYTNVQIFPFFSQLLKHK